MEIVKSFNRAMDRQIIEGCYIMSPEADLLMNDKFAHVKPMVGRMVVSTVAQSGRRKDRNTG